MLGVHDIMLSDPTKNALKPLASRSDQRAGAFDAAQGD